MLNFTMICLFSSAGPTIVKFNLKTEKFQDSTVRYINPPKGGMLEIYPLFTPILINGVKMEESVLKTEDEIEIGPYKIIFEFDGHQNMSNDEPTNNDDISQLSDKKPISEDHPVTEQQSEDLGEPLEKLDDDTVQQELSEDNSDVEDFIGEGETDSVTEEFTDESNEEFESEGGDYTEESYGEETYNDENYDEGGEYDQGEGEVEYSDESSEYDDNNYEMEESAGEKTQVFSGIC